MSLRILVNGASGKMGQEVVKAIGNEHDLELVGQLDHQDNLADAIKTLKPKVVVDFTSALVAFENCETIIENGAHPVIGTTGLKPEQIKLLQQRCLGKQLGGIIAPNFAIGALLLMRCAKEIVQYFPHVEIIELHHNRKVDAPSGTAIKTAEEIASARKESPAQEVEEHEMLQGARGCVKDDIRIHSVRLPGLVAHEEVIFGDTGQTLSLRHDTYNREAFMPGVILACRKVPALNKLVYGLEHLL
jgi:4-hydroxy-tetrahydrodipicolinate reductase